MYSFKNEGILYPSGAMQFKLINEFYTNVKIDPSMVSYVEAHGTGNYRKDIDTFSMNFLISFIIFSPKVLKLEIQKNVKQLTKYFVKIVKNHC